MILLEVNVLKYFVETLIYTVFLVKQVVHGSRGCFGMSYYSQTVVYYFF